MQLLCPCSKAVQHIYLAFSAGVQKCGRALSPSAQKLGVRQRFFLHFILYAHECGMAMLIRYVCVTKNSYALLTFTENFAALV